MCSEHDPAGQGFGSGGLATLSFSCRFPHAVVGKQPIHHWLGVLEEICDGFEERDTNNTEETELQQSAAAAITTSL